jgi:hypothetical protein
VQPGEAVEERSPPVVVLFGVLRLVDVGAVERPERALGDPEAGVLALAREGELDEERVGRRRVLSLFNGKNLKGWWEGCGSSHANNDKTNGGIWLVDSVTGVLFANQNTNGAGSVLMTNKSYLNYEIIFDLWPTFGNDGGLFNRVTPSGNCYQTTIDYIQGSGIGGTYFEGGYTGSSRNYDPFVFGANKHTISIGTNSNVNNRLDTITKRFGTPTAYGCAATGCAPAHWTAIWDTGGWNQMRVKFFGTGASAANKVHNFVWLRKLGSPSSSRNAAT